MSAGKNGLLLQVCDENGNLAKMMANKSQIETTPDGEVMLQIGNDFSYDLVYDDGTHGTIRGARLIEKIEEENQTTPLQVTLSADQIKAMSVRGVTISLLQDGIERLFIPEKYVVRDVAAGRCAVYLYPNHQYSYVPTSDEHKRLSVNGEKLGSLLGVAIKQTSEGSSLSRRIAAVERRMGIENAKHLGEMLLGMADQNLYTAGDYDTVIRNLRKNQIDLTSEIADMQEKRLCNSCQKLAALQNLSVRMAGIYRIAPESKNRVLRDPQPGTTGLPQRCRKTGERRCRSVC